MAKTAMKIIKKIKERFEQAKADLIEEDAKASRFDKELGRCAALQYLLKYIEEDSGMLDCKTLVQEIKGRFETAKDDIDNGYFDEYKVGYYDALGELIEWIDMIQVTVNCHSKKES